MSIAKSMRAEDREQLMRVAKHPRAGTGEIVLIDWQYEEVVLRIFETGKDSGRLPWSEVEWVDQ